MEDIDILNLWKTYTKRLEEHLVLDAKNAADITHMKVRSLLFSMKPVKIFAILTGLIWVGFVDVLIINLYHIANPFFLLSAGIQVLLTKIAVGIYLYQVILIQRVDISEPVMETQATLARLKSTTLLVARILFLQLPVWTMFYWNNSMLQNGTVLLFTVQVLVTLSFTIVAAWLFINIKFENRQKKWFRVIFDGKEWSPVLKSIDMLQELKEFKTDTVADLRIQ